MPFGVKLLSIPSYPNDIASGGQKLPRNPEHCAYPDLQSQNLLDASDLYASLFSHGYQESVEIGNNPSPMFIRYGQSLVFKVNEKTKVPRFGPRYFPFFVIEFNTQPSRLPLGDQHL